MNIYNFTGRDINIYDRNQTYIHKDKLYLKEFELSPKYIIKACCDSSDLPRVYSEVVDQWVGPLNLPIQRFTDAEPIEDFCPNFDPRTDVLIAPNIWINATRTLQLIPAYTQLASVYNLVYNSKGQTVGCLGLEYK